MAVDTMFRCIVLDAMGVLFEAADDVAELLVPFVRAANPAATSQDVEAAYLSASLGDLDADSFWRKLGLDPEVEDLYLKGHSMVPGAIAFLQAARHVGIPVWCLSNDVERWSVKLRANFKVESYLEGTVISSAARARKPSPEIYRLLLSRSGYAADEIIFVDDREKNVAAARELGIGALHFSRDVGYEALKRKLLQDRGARAPQLKH
jgi:HAD superfamily hydrolase (TIGR01509 family)